MDENHIYEAIEPLMKSEGKTVEEKMIQAIFVDFYGTVVHEDGEVIKKITDIIYETGEAVDKQQIDVFWWKEFQTLFMNSYGEHFETQRVLEYKSLVSTLARFQSNADPVQLSNRMFDHWIKPPLFEESREFFEQSPVPVYIVSNIDTQDILRAIKYHDLRPAGVFTSEDARSYKPHSEIFELALKSCGLNAGEVVHIGDSLNSDVNGAKALGIHTLWMNRSPKKTPENVRVIGNLLEAFDILLPR